MKLGPLIPEVNILCVKSEYNCPLQANFFGKWYSLFQEYAVSLREHYPHLKIKWG